MREIDLALAHHELIKVRINGADRDELKTLATDICTAMEATQVQLIGHILILYRPAIKPLIQLP